MAERCQLRDLPGFEDGVALLDLLASLPDKRREAFVLTQLMGMPYAAAAEVSDCPIGTVRSRVARTRATLVEFAGGCRGETPARRSWPVVTGQERRVRVSTGRVGGGAW